jgi:hypothetical protein
MPALLCLKLAAHAVRRLTAHTLFANAAVPASVTPLLRLPDFQQMQCLTAHTHALIAKLQLLCKSTALHSACQLAGYAVSASFAGQVFINPNAANSAACDAVVE